MSNWRVRWALFALAVAVMLGGLTWWIVAARRSAATAEYVFLHINEYGTHDLRYEAERPAPVASWNTRTHRLTVSRADALPGPRTRVLVVHEVAAATIPLLSEAVRLDRLPAPLPLGIGGGGAGNAPPPESQVLEAHADGSVVLLYAGERIELGPGERWRWGRVRRAGSSVPLADGEGWQQMVEEALARGEELSTVAIYNEGRWPVSGAQLGRP